MRNILCPVDFSDLSAQALRYAGRLSRACGARITVMYADLFQPPPYFTEAQIETLQRQTREARRGAEASLRAFAQTALGPYVTQFAARVVEAVPEEGIRQAAGETHADLIVMGTHGRTGVNRWMLGSVAERVLRSSAIPVLTVRSDRPPRKIVAVADGSPESQRSLAVARELAACTGAELAVLETPREIDAARGVVEHASQAACDLLVLGARHHTFFDSTVLGATTARIVRHAPCPVLTVIQPAAAAEAQNAV